MTVDELLAGIRNEDENVRTETWQASAAMGAVAVPALAELSAEPDLEAARAAVRGLWAVTRHAGRPDAGGARAEVAAALILLTTPEHAEQLRREAIWMLSEVGGDEAVPVLAGLLSDAALRDDARMALERIPGEVSLAALREGLATAPDDFQPNLAHSLRVRGESVPDVPDMRLVPRKPTAVTSAGRIER